MSGLSRVLRATTIGIPAALGLIFSAGCSFQEALLDGFYGGISDTIAGAISGFLLGIVGQN